MLRFFLLLFGAYISLFASAGATPYMQVGGNGSVVNGFTQLCVKDNAVCKPGVPSVITLTDQVRQELTSVNRQVNASIRYVSDGPGKDVWSVDVTQGDCEEYVLAKREKLEALGLPTGALLITLVKDKEYHVVLVVHTNTGDYVLDSLRAEVVRWDTLPYTWISRTSPINPLHWEKIGNS